MMTSTRQKKKKAMNAPLLQNFTVLPFSFCTYGCEDSFHTQILIHTHPCYKLLKSKATTRTQGHISICCQASKNPFAGVSWNLPEVVLFLTTFPLALHSWN